MTSRKLGPDERKPPRDEQLILWASGESVCPNASGECCPDFSCCVPELGFPIEKRLKFVESDQVTREKMMMGALGAAIAHAITAKVHITRGVPEDHE
jgi:hypothetical protein